MKRGRALLCAGPLLPCPTTTTRGGQPTDRLEACSAFGAFEQPCSLTHIWWHDVSHCKVSLAVTPPPRPVGHAQGLVAAALRRPARPAAKQQRLQHLPRTPPLAARPRHSQRSNHGRPQPLRRRRQQALPAHAPYPAPTRQWQQERHKPRRLPRWCPALSGGRTAPPSGMPQPASLPQLPVPLPRTAHHLPPRRLPPPLPLRLAALVLRRPLRPACSPCRWPLLTGAVTRVIWRGSEQGGGPFPSSHHRATLRSSWRLPSQMPPRRPLPLRLQPLLPGAAHLLEWGLPLPLQQHLASLQGRAWTRQQQRSQARGAS